MVCSINWTNNHWMIGTLNQSVFTYVLFSFTMQYWIQLFILSKFISFLCILVFLDTLLGKVKNVYFTFALLSEKMNFITGVSSKVLFRVIVKNTLWNNFCVPNTELSHISIDNFINFYFLSNLKFIFHAWLLTKSKRGAQKIKS